MIRLFLIGYMGAGKTTFGKKIAKSLSLDFIDMDSYIESRYQKSVSDLFETKGEIAFRSIEHNILEEIATFENIIISTGGGTPCFYDNMDLMNKSGITLYLKSSPKFLVERLVKRKTQRPLLKNKNEQELITFVDETLKVREPFYLKAHAIVEMGQVSTKEDIEKYVYLIEETIKKMV